MTPPALLIAGREFRLYVATISFWAALALGPAIVIGGSALVAGQASPPPPQTLTLVKVADRKFEARYSKTFPLSPAARAEVVGMIARESGLDVRQPPPTTAGVKPADGVAGIRLAMMIMLWMTLTGSLGMLLQATVRERANRSLESLLAAARPWEIVGGKLVGIGAVSTLVVVSWLGSAALAAVLTSARHGAGPSLPSLLAQPTMLLGALGLYGLSFAFYGLITIALGAGAKDSADAQNLARPMFAVLLVVFFTALFSNGSGAAGLSWLVYLPPFAPFLLLLHPRPLIIEAVSFALLIAATTAAGWWAMQSIGLDRSRRGSIVNAPT